MIYYSSVRKIGERYKLCCMDFERSFSSEYDRRSSERGTVHDFKLQASLSRTKRIIFEYGLCNDWEYFVTLTLDSKKYDRYNLKGYIKDLCKWLSNYKRNGCDVKYLFVPEQHTDGAWHIHGLILGLPVEHLSDFIEGVHPYKLVSSGYKNWNAYEKKFGFVSLGRIRNKEACVLYMMKYITKDLANSAVGLNNNLVYHSQHLNKADYVLKGQFIDVDNDFNFDFKNDFCRIKNVNFIKDFECFSDVHECFGDLVSSGEVMDFSDFFDIEVSEFQKMDNFVSDCGEQLNFLRGCCE